MPVQPLKAQRRDYGAKVRACITAMLRKEEIMTFFRRKNPKEARIRF